MLNNVTECRCLIHREEQRHVKNVKTVNPFPNKPWFLRACSTSL